MLATFYRAQRGLTGLMAAVAMGLALLLLSAIVLAAAALMVTMIIAAIQGPSIPVTVIAAILAALAASIGCVFLGTLLEVLRTLVPK